jgi:hypothetical protein
MNVAWEILITGVFVFAGLVVWSCLLLASWADGEMSRFDEFRFAPEEKNIMDE